MANIAITISRTYGSGGKAIGQLVAKQLGMEFYDEQLIRLSSEISGINEEYFQKMDEKRMSLGQQIRGLFQPSVLDSDVAKALTKQSDLTSENLYRVQAMVIEQLALHENCVIIGRAAFYILRDKPNAVRVHIEAPMEDCVQTVMRRLSIPEQEARALIKKTNKERNDYHRHYTDQNWRDAGNYDLVLNTRFLSREECADIIAQYAETRRKHIPY